MVRNYKKVVERSMLVFKVLCKINPITKIYNLFSDSLLYNWLVVSMPILFFSGNIFIMIKNGVLYSNEEKFTYINDLSNSLGLTILFFTSIFLSRYYPKKFDEWVNEGIEKVYRNEILNKVKNTLKMVRCRIILVVVSVLLCLFAFNCGNGFYKVAKSNVGAFWIINLNKFGRIYYCFFLTITWYHSLVVLGMALSGGIVIYGCLKDKKINYIDELYNKNTSIIEMVDILLCNFSFGLFYIVGAFLFIINDRISYIKYKIQNTFCDDVNAFILIIIILILVSLAYMPLRELIKYMCVKKKEYIKTLESKKF